MTDELPVCVLEIGGTHVTAALVELYDEDANVPVSLRRPLDCHAGADEVLDTIADAARELGDYPGMHWGVAIPGPLDYELGIGRFENVGKFDALNGVDIGHALADRLTTSACPPAFSFVNDATAFAIGEWYAGAARGKDRVVCVTLGTGTGGAFLRAGVPVTSGDDVPPEGVLHLLQHEGDDLEDHVSRRALIGAYRKATGRDADVLDIAEAARGGEADALAAVEHYYDVLARVLNPWLDRFGAEVLVIGGSIARSWDLAERFLLPRMHTETRLAQLPEAAPLVGAAVFARPSRSAG